MSVKQIVAATVAGFAALVMTAVPLSAQMTGQQHAMAAQGKPAAGMDAKCQAMMADHEKMMADMKAADRHLDDLVATMNSATGMEKAAATSIVVTEMVAQRNSMRDGMMKMQMGMMSHMMEHMQAGKESMASCPMMKHMGDMKH